MAIEMHDVTREISRDTAKARTKILNAYKRAGCSQRHAARLLRASERTFIRWVEELGIVRKLHEMRKQATREGWLNEAFRQGGRRKAAA
ncbi:MAG: hypothetical protein PVSMB8_03740 [Vulcanimicrobiaceae bacterium]